MPRFIVSSIWMSAALIPLAGCATVNPQLDYERVGRHIAQATGQEQVYKPQDDQLVSELVEGLLRDGISAADIQMLFTILIGAGSLLIVPGLCVSGLITHACECAEETSCVSECHCDVESGCEHESGCSEDPCSIWAVRAERRGDDSITPPQLATFTSTFLSEGWRLLGEPIGSGLRETSRHYKPSYSPGDLPLLI